MTLHIIVGAGPVGTATAELLAARGERVRIVTRRGSGPDHPAIQRIAADATDADRLSEIAQGAAVLYNCASPPYHRWTEEWPPLLAAFLTAAERSGAVFVSYSNLYGYGDTGQPMKETTPLAATHRKLRLRADMWREALAGHQAGRIRAAEVRASDHIQPESFFGTALAKPAVEGKSVLSPIPLDAPHSWTSVQDSAKLLAAVAADERAWGKAWHVPTNPPMSAIELFSRFCDVAGLRFSKPRVLPYPVFWALGLAVPMLYEMRATYYQFKRPFIIDASAATATFDLKPAPLEEALHDTLRLLRRGAS